MKSKKEISKIFFRGPGGSIYTGEIFINLPKAIKKWLYKIRFVNKLDVDIKEEICRKSNNNNTAIDCGANVGIWTDILLQMGYRVVAIEPNKDCYEYLVERYIGNDKVIVENVALSDYEGKNHFESEHAFSQGGSLNDEPINAERGKGIEVTVKKLSSYIKEFRPSLVKIDIEGEEIKVINEMLNELDEKEISNCFFAVETHERKIVDLDLKIRDIKIEIERRNIEKHFNFNWT